MPGDDLYTGLDTFNGELAITPPIPWPQIKGSPFLPGHRQEPRDERSLRFRLDEQVEEQDDGTLIRRRAVALRPDGRTMVAKRVVEALQEALDTFPDHEFSGRLNANTEEGMPWRLQVRDRRAVRVAPQIVWPDDEAKPEPESVAGAVTQSDPPAVADAPAGPAPERALLAALPWVTQLPQRDLYVFARELSAVCSRAARSGRWEQVGQLLREWKATADIHADPDLVNRLRAPVSDDPEP